MRRFRDRDGLEWDVVIGRESWGTLYALFVPARTGSAAVRQAVLEASAVEAATLELERLDEAGLQALLDRTTIKES